VKVCIDIQPAIAQRAGVGRYTRSLVEHLGPHAGDDELVLFSFDFKRKAEALQTAGATHRTIRWCPGRIAQRSWRTLGWPPFNAFSGPADLYHFTNFVKPPLTTGKSVVTIHDAAFLRYPDTMEERNYRYLSGRIGETVRQADAIITVSEFTARELTELLRVPPNRLFPIHLGLDAHLKPAPEADLAAMRKALGLARPYILTVGTLEPRKNTRFLVEVFEQLARFDGDLVVAGMPGWKHEPALRKMRTSPCADRIRYLQFVEEQHLPALYTGASLFVLPSLYEGFGFPPLEAMACGTPAVTSAAGSLPEVVGEAGVIVQGFDEEHWAATLDALLEDAGRLDTLRERGFAHAREYSWDTTARRTWDVYRGVME
jgi:glycosyltransferase involved in cell wall biosynthesis